MRVLGGAAEVGRSGFLVETDDCNIVMDYGVMFERRGEPAKYPLHVRPRDVDAVVISHAHLDHSGSVPSLFVSGSAGVYCTSPTMELSVLLIEDMLKLNRNAYPFDIPEINSMRRNYKETEYGQKVSMGGTNFELRESGHVIGGSTVLVESEGKRLFYTGDINVSGSRMLRNADLDIGEIDLLITESTYSQKEQTPRAESEREFLEFANTIMDEHGTLFVPSFSLERAQEIACVLRNANFKHRIIMDGMALSVNEIILRHPEFLRDPDVFRDAIKHATSIKSQNERKKALKEPCVVISPAGMLVGGNAVFYLQALASDSKNGIALVSYQGEGTPGRMLLETGTVSARGKEIRAAAQVRQFEFSGHSGRSELFEMIGKIKGNPKVLTVHGDVQSCETFASEIHEQFGLDARAACLNDTVPV